jgi:hypothetical protein
MASITVNTDGSGTAMKDILPAVRTRLGSSTQTGKDADLAILAEIAVAKYSEICPRIVRSQITTVSGQVAYPLPNDCKNLYDVYLPQLVGYYNDAIYLPMIDNPSSSLFSMSEYAYRAPSERFIRSGIMTELDHYSQTFIGYVFERGVPPQIYLLPMAQADGVVVKIRYGADHVNTSSDPANPSWNTLPPGHWQHIISLILWAVAMQRADQVTSSMTMSSVDGGSRSMTQSWQLLNRADRMLTQIENALGANVTVAMRS